MPQLKLSPLSLAIAMSLLSGQTLAQDKTSSSTPAAQTLKKVTVTATRSEEEVLKQAIAIDKKSGEELQLDQVVFQKDALNSMAGVKINQTSSVIGHMTAIRTPTTTLPYFLFLQDNIPVQSSGFFNHNALAYTNFQTADSVEVMKGAGTALYGSDSVAATINVQSPKLSQALERKIRVYGGSDGFKQGGVSVSDTVGAHGYRLEGNLTQSDGWRDHTKLDRHEINGQYTYLGDENDFKVALVNNHSKAEQAGSLLSLDELENNPESVGDIKDKLDVVDANRQFDMTRLSAEWNNYSLDGVDFNTIAYVRNTRNQYTATWENNLPLNDSKQDTLGLMHKGQFNPSWGRFIYGLDTEFTKGTLKYTQEFDYTPSGWGKPVPEGTIYDYKVDYFAIAPYVHTDWNMTEAMTLSGGLRYDRNEYDYKNQTSDGEYASSGYLRPKDRTDKYEHLSPKLALAYQLDASSMLYTRYANAFRVPSATRLYKLKTKNGDFSLDPETSNTYEVGYKLGTQSANVEVAVFYMDINDTITKYKDTDKLEYYKNGGTTSHKGGELTYGQAITPEWSTKLAYSYSEHRFENDDTYGNDEMANAPNHVANLRVFYRPAALSGFVVMAEGVYNSDYWMDNSHTKKYSGYTLYNLKADYQINPTWRTFAKLDNVTDNRYAENARYSYGKEKYTPGAPRQVFIGAEATF